LAKSDAGMSDSGSPIHPDPAGHVEEGAMAVMAKLPPVPLEVAAAALRALGVRAKNSYLGLCLLQKGTRLMKLHRI